MAAGADRLTHCSRSAPQHGRALVVALGAGDRTSDLQRVGEPVPVAERLPDPERFLDCLPRTCDLAGLHECASK